MYDGILEIVNGVDQIYGNLYQGGIVPDTSEFEYVICVTPEAKHYDRTGRFTFLAPFHDTPHGLPTPMFLAEIVETTLRCMARGKTLVQCSAGLNRSGLIVGMVLIHHGLTPQDAVDHMRKVRSCSVLHNENFLQYVLDFAPWA